MFSCFLLLPRRPPGAEVEGSGALVGEKGLGAPRRGPALQVSKKPSWELLQESWLSRPKLTGPLDVPTPDHSLPSEEGIGTQVHSEPAGRAPGQNSRASKTNLKALLAGLAFCRRPPLSLQNPFPFSNFFKLPPIPGLTHILSRGHSGSSSPAQQSLCTHCPSWPSF